MADVSLRLLAAAAAWAAPCWDCSPSSTVPGLLAVKARAFLLLQIGVIALFFLDLSEVPHWDPTLLGGGLKRKASRSW